MTSSLEAFNPTPGVAEDLAPQVRRILAPNPSPMTYRGTNTYLIGTQDVAVIDPGPSDPAHLAAILSAIGPSDRISHILVTHSHLDHSALAPDLRAQTDAPILAYGAARAGRSPIMQRLAHSGLAAGGEGVDVDFSCDQALEDKAWIKGKNWALQALHTPGHIGNHLCFALGRQLFCGDHVMGWSSSLVSPPDGDLTDFMRSCRRIRSMEWDLFYPGHGAPIEQPNARLDWLIEHRLNREHEIIQHLQDAPATAETLAREIYTSVPQALLAAAERNVFAHLIDLHQREVVDFEGDLHTGALFHYQK